MGRQQQRMTVPRRLESVFVTSRLEYPCSASCITTDPAANAAVAATVLMTPYT